MKKYCKIYLVGALVINFSWGMILTAKAQAESRWWTREEIPTLNVYKDLKVGNGNIYYVDGKNGDDRNSGGTFKTAFKTIGRALDRYGPLKAGDIILIKAGRYREHLFFNQKGTLDNRIFIGAAGDGEVIIDASLPVGEWEGYKGNVYKAKCEGKPVAVVVDEQPLFPEFSADKVDEGKWYYDADKKEIYLYVPGGGIPSGHEVGVVLDDKYSHAIFLHGASYVTLYGLTVKFAGGKGIEILGKGNHIIKCNTRFNGSSGIGMFSYGDAISSDLRIIKNSVYHNFLQNWPRGRYKSGDWGAGISGGGCPGAVISGNVIHKTGGEGIVVPGAHSLIQDNIVFDNWSVNIYASDRKDVTVDRNLCFCHEPNAAELYNNRDKNPRDGRNFRRLRAEGIMTADEAKKATTEKVWITNNIIINCRRGITHYGKGRGSGLKNVFIAHNTIIVPPTKGLNEEFVGLRIPYNGGNNENSFFVNNIVYASHPDTYLVSLETGINPVANPFKGISFNNNLWFHKSRENSFYTGIRFGEKIRKVNFKEWKATARENGQGKNSLLADPKFLHEDNFLLNNSISLLPDSPAIDRAAVFKEISVDYDGKPRNDKKPDIGAIEYQSQERK